MSPRADEQIVMFDAVGTLICADPTVTEVYRTAGAQFGVELACEEIKARFAGAYHAHTNGELITSESVERRRWRNVVADVFRELPPTTGEFEKLFGNLWSHFAKPHAWRVFDDVEDCLDRLQQSGMRIGLASNFDRRLHEVCLGHRALRDLERFVSSDLGFAKPHRSFFQTIESRLSVSPSVLTLVGDDVEADYRGAASAGWRSVLLDRSGECGDGGLRSLSELPALLANHMDA